MSNIRVTYSGLIQFIVGIITVFTGLIFLTIVTRSLTVEEYGTWGLLLNLLSYVIVLEPLVSYSVGRESPRNLNSAKTAIFSSTILSFFAIIIYIIILFKVSYTTTIPIEILIFSAILLPVMFLVRTLEAINLGWKPQNNAFGLITFGIITIPSSFITLQIFEWGLFGLLLTYFLANTGRAIILGILARSKLHPKFDFKFITKWYKLSWISRFPGINLLLLKSDIIIVTIMFSSVSVLAFWIASRSISGIIEHTVSISKGLSPKLLSGGNYDTIKQSLNYFFYFSFPLVGLIIVFADSALFVLNPIYKIAYIVAIFLSLYTFFNALSVIFQGILAGIEKVDTNEKSTVRDYLKSKLFVTLISRTTQYSVYLITLSIMLFLTIGNVDEIEILKNWSMVLFFIQLPHTLFLYALIKKDIPNFIYTKKMIKYLAVTIIVFGSFSLISEDLLVYNESIFQFLPNFLWVIAIPLVIYFSITIVIDSTARELVKKIINEIKK